MARTEALVINKKRFALVCALLSGVYVFVPEPTDLIPVIGWLDEGLAVAIFAWSMRTLGVSPAALFRRRTEVIAVATEPVETRLQR